MLGIIGVNGAGKSTLLRLIGGVGKPDEGGIVVNGKIGALLDLGTGFHPDLTGRENIYISGVIAGLLRQQVSDRFDEIVEFSELAEFIDHPVRTYSTGMLMRLAFSVAVHTEPDILLIDEVLAVGDIAFQRKCLERITQFKSQGCAILLVSHDMATVRQLCDEALWLQKGLQRAHGPTDVVVGQYVAEMAEETKRRTLASQPPRLTASGVELRVNENRFGSLEMEITDVQLLDEVGIPTLSLKSGRSLQVRIQFMAHQIIDAPIFGVTLRQEDDSICFESNISVSDLDVQTLEGQGEIVLKLDRLDLNGGVYNVDVGVYERDWAYAYDYHWHTYTLTVLPAAQSKGALLPPYRWEIFVAER
jgi:lipopolysaccharide transport system ATP-binding protein